MLSEIHPDVFGKAVQNEESQKNDRRLTWNEQKSLSELFKRNDEIIPNAKHKLKGKRIGNLINLR